MHYYAIRPIQRHFPLLCKSDLMQIRSRMLEDVRQKRHRVKLARTVFEGPTTFRAWPTILLQKLSRVATQYDSQANCLVEPLEDSFSRRLALLSNYSTCSTGNDSACSALQTCSNSNFRQRSECIRLSERSHEPSWHKQQSSKRAIHCLTHEPAEAFHCTTKWHDIRPNGGSKKSDGFCSASRRNG